MYLLGIMTPGKDFNALTGVLRDISRFVYSEVDSHTKKTKH